MKQAATALDVEAVRVTFALEAEEWFVEQFADLNHGKGFLEKFLGRRLEEHLLTGDEREKLHRHLTEVRKVKGSNVRLDGKPRKRADGALVHPDGTVVSPDRPGR